MNVEIGTKTPIFIFWEYLFQIFGILSLQCVSLTANEGPMRIQYINVRFPVMYSQKWNCSFQNRIKMFCLPVPTLIYLWEKYIFPGSVCIFCCRKMCGPILGICKSLTDTWMWKLGLRTCNFQKRNTYTGFSLQCGYGSDHTKSILGPDLLLSLVT